MARSLGLMALFAIVFFGGGLLFSEPPPAAASQPIAFNHRLHKTLNIGCGECHFRCEKNRDESGDLACEACARSDVFFCSEHVACPDHKLPDLPSVEVCATCHASDEAETPQKAALMEYIDTQRPIPWQRVTFLDEANAYFSHRRHAQLGRIACSECHGDVGGMEAPPAAPPVAMSMDWCLQCHREKEQSQQCVNCHR